MKRVMEQLWELMTGEESRHRVPIYDEATPKGISYDQLRRVSGRVYAWLKARGIGKEDFVMIKLPRGVQPIIAMTGVWRAGAAFVLVEDTMAPERIDFIYKDCGCKLAITGEAWEEINQLEPLEGYEETDLHDAAYAVYTSGTTGNPKGVLHEYGNLERSIQSFEYEGEQLGFPGIRFALAAPMSFVPSIMVSYYILYRGCCTGYVLSYSTVRNPAALMKFLLTKKISAFFLTPTYARKFSGRTGPFLKLMLVGSEPANNYYLKGVKNFNVYAQSEGGIFTTVFCIDREYDMCPVGKPQFDLKYRIIDEEGNDVPEGGIGEFIFENPYGRGYINLPEETARVFKEGFFYTGDLMQRLPDGNLVIRGRKNDMIKINGNRIEPAEIESAVCTLLNIDWCAVRGFINEDHSFICAYYKDDIVFDADELRAGLLRRLPHYMIPAHFMKIDAVPVNRNGKLDRNALPKPEIREIVRTYREPENETEARLCRGMEKVLGLEWVGIDDDFYEMGGDSLRSMELLVECDLPGLDVNQIFRGRTSCKIAELYLNRRSLGDSGSEAEQDEKARGEAHKLTAEQLYIFDYQLYTPKSTMYNLFTMLRMEKAVMDPQRLAKAVEMAIRNHPALMTRLSFSEEGDLVQRYDPDMPVAIKAERLSLAALDAIKDTLVQPFKIVDAPLYRCRLFETEEAVYLFFDVHHLIFDGSSFKVFMNSVVNAGLGIPLEPDHYYRILQNRREAEQTEFYQQSREYFERTYGGENWTLYPPVDHKTRGNKLGSLRSGAAVSAAQLSLAEKKLMVSRNEFFIGTALLALAISAGKSNVQVS